MNFADFPTPLEQPLFLSKEEWLDPKRVIRRLFEDWSFPDLVSDLRLWLKAAFSHERLPRKRTWAGQSIHDILLRLLEVGWLLEGEEKSIVPEGADLMNRRWWLGRVYRDAVPFDHFPRSLSKKEYCNPYLVFYKCRAKYTLSEWRAHLDACWVASISGDLFHELWGFHISRQVARLLPKLVDAAYLVHVREFFVDKITSKQKTVAK